MPGGTFAYCDRWCERCAFTERCSNYAVQIATAMCDGDFRAALELAVGPPQPVDGERAPTVGERLLEEFEQIDVSDRELEELSRQEDESRARLEQMGPSRAATTYMLQAHDWLAKRRGAGSQSGDVVVRDALDTIAWDMTLIGTKLHRALDAGTAINAAKKTGTRIPSRTTGMDRPKSLCSRSGVRKRRGPRSPARRRIGRRRSLPTRSASSDAPSVASSRARWTSPGPGSTSRGAERLLTVPCLARPPSQSTRLHDCSCTLLRGACPGG